MATRPSVTQRQGRLTSACLMAVRNTVQRFLGNRRYKGWKGRRMRPQTASPVTLWQMWVFLHLPKRHRKKALWIMGLLLSFLCSALSPTAHKPKKGSGRCLTTGIWGFSWQNKTIKCGGWLFLRFTFPSLSLVLITASTVPLVFCLYPLPLPLSSTQMKCLFSLLLVCLLHFYLSNLKLFPPFCHISTLSLCHQLLRLYRCFCVQLLWPHPTSNFVQTLVFSSTDLRAETGRQGRLWVQSDSARGKVLTFAQQPQRKHADLHHASIKTRQRGRRKKKESLSEGETIRQGIFRQRQRPVQVVSICLP